MIPSRAWELPTDDLDASIERSEDDLRRWASARILVTGGTGFLGRWITSTAIRANLKLKLDMQIHIVSRSITPEDFDGIPNLKILRGDIRDFSPPGSYDIVIHGAASSSSPVGVGDGSPSILMRTIIDGTRQVIETASRSRARTLFLSSGAVYGPQTSPVSEETTTGPDPLDPASAYGQAKRAAENLCAIATSESAVEAVVARLFAFVGPGIPLDVHYAAGNFLDDIRSGRPIVVRGDGRPLRSYLYCGDLSEWCWALLSRGAPGVAYNVGSDEVVSIRELASRIAALVEPHANVEVLGPPGKGPAPCYVPLIDRATRELHLEPRIVLDAALSRTFTWITVNRKHQRRS